MEDTIASTGTAKRTQKRSASRRPLQARRALGWSGARDTDEAIAPSRVWRRALPQPISASLTPASDTLSDLVPLAALFDAIVSLASVLGVTYIALGLVQARRYEDRPADAAALVVPVAATLATIIGVLAASRFDFGDTPLTPPLAIYLAATVALGILRVVAWAYLAATVIRGWWSGEEPNTGWWLAVLATALVLIALALVNVSGILDTSDTTFVTAYGYVTATAYALGHLCLLAAFAVGLPALDALDDEDTDAVEEDEDPDDRRRRRPPCAGLAPVDRQGGDEVPHEVEPLVDLFDRRVGTGHQDARATGQRDARQVAPRLAQRRDRPRWTPRACR